MAENTLIRALMGQSDEYDQVMILNKRKSQVIFGSRWQENTTYGVRSQWTRLRNRNVIQRKATIPHCLPLGNFVSSHNLSGESNFEMDAAGSKEVNPFDHAVKRRAGAACTRCQSRKVRCDLTIHGSPCTNCKLDGMPCTTRPSRRQRYVDTFTTA